MNRRRPLTVATALTTTAVLLLTACGSSDEKPGTKDKIAGADQDDKGEPSSSPNPKDSAKRPKIQLPSDITYEFQWSETGDKKKDAVLFDGEQFIKATDMAIAEQDPLHEAYRFYSGGELAAATEEYIKRFVGHGARTTGRYRFYNEVISLKDDDTASLIYCEDQGKAYNKYIKSGKIDKTAVTKNSYVLYNTRLRKNEQGIWITEDMISQRGSRKCQP